jgi:hypothetical protein
MKYECPLGTVASLNRYAKFHASLAPAFLEYCGDFRVVVHVATHILRRNRIIKLKNAVALKANNDI